MQMPTDFTLNAHTDYGQDNPDLAALPNGLFVAVWEDADQDYGETGYDGFTGVYGAVFNAQGQRLTPEFKVPNNDYFQQFDPKVVAFEDGTWVVAWNSDGYDRNGISTDINVYFQRFGINAAGQVVRLGAQVQVSPDRPEDDDEGFYDQRLQDLVLTEDGGFRIITAGSDVDTDWMITSREFTSTGQAVGPERLMEDAVETYLASAWVLRTPGYDTVTDGNGGMWAAYWEGIQGQPDGGSHVWLQHYANDGSKLGARISISAMGDPADNEYPVIARLTNGNMVVAWDYEHEEDLQDHDIHARIVSANGAPISTIFRINSDTTEMQELGEIIPLAHGAFLVAYTSWYTNDGPYDYYDVRARMFDANGNAVGSILSLSQYIYEDAAYLTAETLTDGTIVLSWSAGGTVDEDVYGVSVDPDELPAIPWAGTANGDVMRGLDMAERISGLGGNDTIQAGGGADLIFGDAGADRLDGQDGNDTIQGGSGDDIISGGRGSDIMAGGTGHDVYLVDNRNDVVIEKPGEGVDRVNASVSYSIATSHVEILNLIGNGNISGTGNSLANEIYGNNGDNVLNGMGGGDVLTGRGGDDLFLFSTALGNGNVDRITDFNVADDRIGLDNAIFHTLSDGALLPSAFRVGTAAGDASDRIIYNPNNGALLYDADGTGAGAAVLFAVLEPGLAMTPGDFLVV
jgi:Ca2+-binding RTX toxin-like protein